MKVGRSSRREEKREDGDKGVEAKMQSNMGGMADRGTCPKLFESEEIRAASIGLDSVAVAVIMFWWENQSEEGNLYFFFSPILRVSNGYIVSGWTRR